MRLSHRTAQPAELATCFHRFGEGFAYSADVRDRVPALWRRWVENGQMMTQVIEDQTDLGRPEIVGFGAAVFLTESLAAALRTDPMPQVRAELVRRACAGEQVVLAPDEVATLNRGAGLSLLFINDALTNGTLDDNALHLVHERWSEALYELRAFHLRELFWEIRRTKIQRWSEGCGLILRRQWPAPREASREDEGVYLVGLTREEARQTPGTHASYLFAYVPPRFDFTPRQQELLRCALDGSTDAALATTLHLSLAAVKKRWISIYEHVSARAPGWLEAEAAEIVAPGETRGAEKRRRLLHYLRQHPEELHPANARAA